MTESSETATRRHGVQPFVCSRVRNAVFVCLLVCNLAALGQTRRDADLRVTASLDEIARRPASHAFAADATPREIYEPERAIRRRNTAAAAAGATAVREPATLPAAPALIPPVYNGFQALGDNFTAIPPDTQGAVGPQDLVTMLNTQVTIQSRTGTVRQGYPITLNAFWSPLGPFSNNALPFDPRIFYDAASDRWIASADSGAQLSSSALLIAASQTGDPGGKWNYYKVAVGATNLWGDFPSLGFNANWVTVSMNMFKISGSGAYQTTNVYVFSKADLYDNSGGKGTHTVFNDPNGEFTAAVDIDNSSPNTLFLLQEFPTGYGPVSGSSAILVWRLKGPVGSEAFNSDEYINIADGWSDTGPGANDFGPQAGTSTRIDTGDSRLGNCVLRSGKIWCAHTLFLPYPRPTRASAQWFQIDPTTNPGTIVQRGRVDDPTNTYFYAYPSIAVNKSGDTMLGYTRFSANDYPTAEFSYRTAIDPLNAMEPDVIFKQGESSYVAAGTRTGSNRWGDYSMTVVDPTGDTNFWTLQEYAAAPPGSRNGAFGTWWAQVAAPSAGLKCTYTVQASGSTFDLSGGTGSIAVAAGTGCLWQAASNTNWISVIGGSPGSGSGTVQYAVAALTSGSRTATITVAGQNVTITQTAPAVTAPSFTEQAVVNAASYQGGSVAPGELITIFGSGLGPPTLQKPAVTAGVVDTSAGGTRVLFDGAAAPMIYSSAGQISAIVPFGLQGHSSTQLQVEYNGTRSTAATIPVSAAVPAIFTASASGKGQGAILNQDFSVNGAGNAATVGSAIMIYLTGAGVMQGQVRDGALAPAVLSIAQQNVVVHIGGIAVTPLYAGAAPGILEGVVQINAVIPTGVAAGTAVPVDVSIGGVTSPAGVTVAIR